MQLASRRANGGPQILGGDAGLVYLDAVCDNDEFLRGSVNRSVFADMMRPELLNPLQAQSSDNPRVTIVLSPDILNSRADWRAHTEWTYGEDVQGKTFGPENFRGWFESKLFAGHWRSRTCRGGEFVFPHSLRIAPFLRGIVVRPELVGVVRSLLPESLKRLVVSPLTMADLEKLLQ